VISRNSGVKEPFRPGGAAFVLSAPGRLGDRLALKVYFIIDINSLLHIRLAVLPTPLASRPKNTNGSLC
jgi:hypothetical protein